MGPSGHSGAQTELASRLLRALVAFLTCSYLQTYLAFSLLANKLQGPRFSPWASECLPAPGAGGCRIRLHEKNTFLAARVEFRSKSSLF
ncbi:hypothetical protein FIBSPDRAFT_861861 [Athelia psychrophila]|uniref:Uncharacterized protein n=1 Tax=Athelia psychrophila TaxID=1759441 RepID=A0A166IZB7_9AGAM|nr:hypothetical protein FIBSPDRAFT_861861 [Fibularhizoctonia sp. CBS 109695]